MPTRDREIHFPVTGVEERNLLAWARQHERPVSAQVRWYLRDILNGAQAVDSAHLNEQEREPAGSSNA
jgi:hypothetical protein